jgi:hypothetical protein
MCGIELYMVLHVNFLSSTTLNSNLGSAIGRGLLLVGRPGSTIGDSWGAATRGRDGDWRCVAGGRDPGGATTTMFVQAW